MGFGKQSSIPSYKSTSVSNPYASAYLNKNGQSSYQLNDFLNNMNTLVENTVPSLYNQLLNPSLDNPVTNARLQAFSDTLKTESQKQFENSLSSLAEKGLLRSSATTDMTNKLAENQTKQISEYANNLIANNTSDVTSLLNTFLNQYLTGSSLGQSAYANAVNSNQLLNNHNLSQNQQSLQGYNSTLSTIRLLAGLGGIIG